MGYKGIASAMAVTLAASSLLMSIQAEAKTTYKVKKKLLVNAKTGKKVAGYKVFQNKLYKNGKLASGYVVYDQGTNKKLYKNGTLAKGTVLKSKQLFKNGRLFKGLTKYKKLYYLDGQLANTERQDIVYKNGKRVEAVKKPTVKEKVTVEDYKVYFGDTWYGTRLADMSDGLILDVDGLVIPGDLDADEVFYTTEHNWYGPEGVLLSDYRYYKDEDGWHEDKTYKTVNQAKSEYNFLKYVIPHFPQLQVGDSFDYYYNYKSPMNHQYSFYGEIVENDIDPRDLLPGTTYMTIAQFNEIYKISHAKPSVEKPEAYEEITRELYATFEKYDEILKGQKGTSTSQYRIDIYKKMESIEYAKSSEDGEDLFGSGEWVPTALNDRLTAYLKDMYKLLDKYEHVSYNDLKDQFDLLWDFYTNTYIEAKQPIN